MIIGTGERTTAWTRGNRLVGFDPELRRLWIGGQRLHHGATGIALAGVAAANLATQRSPRGLAYLIAGGVLVAHDWKDRSVWFRFGAEADWIRRSASPPAPTPRP